MLRCYMRKAFPHIFGPHVKGVFKWFFLGSTEVVPAVVVCEGTVQYIGIG